MKKIIAKENMHTKFMCAKLIGFFSTYKEIKGGITIFPDPAPMTIIDAALQKKLFSENNIKLLISIAIVINKNCMF